ncbi:MAG: DUF2924 domain-containing protein [Sphingobium sp.]
MALIDDRMAGLAAMTPAQLRAQWRRWHRGQVMPAGLGRDLAARAIAWQMQAKVHGGFTPAAARQLQRLTRELEDKGYLDLADIPRLKPGTRLVREWHGHCYQVLVLDSGFEFQDRHYRSLTPIACAITGVHWSGPRFFGLKGKRGGR